MFGLNVTYIMKPGKAGELLEALAASGVQEEIRAEEGCLQYDFFLPADGSDKVLLMEKWVSREAQQLHLTQPHMEKVRTIKPLYVLDTVLETYDLP